MKHSFKIGQQEICDMIVREIGIFHKQQNFFPYRISKTNMVLPEEIEIELEYVSMGSSTKDYPHVLDSGK